MKSAITTSALNSTLAAALLGCFAMAHADPVSDLLRQPAPEIIIGYDDLDISHPRGLEELYTRIERAAMAVCDYDRMHKELARQRRPAACYKAAVEDAVRQVNKPTLTALHKTKAKTIAG
jgi:UrcA family protein